jgi:hypothetical protein
MAPWIYDKKFSVGTQFLFGTLPFTIREDDELEHPAQEQEERHMTMIGFEFPRGLKSSATTFQATVRKPATTNAIDSPTRPQIGTPSITTRSPGSIPGLRQQNVAPLNKVALHLNPDFSTVQPQDLTCGTNQGSCD